MDSHIDGTNGARVSIIGAGPGDFAYMTHIAKNRIAGADIIVGSSRCIGSIPDGLAEGATMIAVDRGFDSIREIVASNSSDKVAIMVSGDTGVFSLASYLKKVLSGIGVEVIPGISSLQYLCAKVGETWNDARIVSLHGRCLDDLEEIVERNCKTILFTGGENRPESICGRLSEAGMGTVHVKVGENLSYESERITEGSADEIAKGSFDSLSLMIIYGGKKAHNLEGSNHEAAWGIPDSEFIRGNIPMTKEEVRTLSLSKLKAKKDSIVWDIGAGTGSVSIQCALSLESGAVYSIERNSEGIDLIRKNAEKFGVSNVNIIEGLAPDALKGLPAPDMVFIGGSGGNLDDIMEMSSSFGKPVRIVVNAITIETAYGSLAAFERLGFSDIDITQVAVSKGRKVGKSHLMEALNPVYIISAQKE